MRLVVSCLYLLFIMCQSNCQPIKGKGYSGFIFEADKFVMVSIENQSTRYTPDKEDIKVTERLIKDKLESLNTELLNQGDNCPIIHENLKKYIRQYVGFYNNNGEKVIWVNFIWKNNTNKDLLNNDIYLPSDGCSHYWNIKVNLDRKELFDLEVNGSA